MTVTSRRQSRKAGIFLVLAVVGFSQGVHATAPKAQMLGALFTVLVFLGLGCWFAFKEGGWFAKFSAWSVASLFTVGLLVGLVRGASHRESVREVSSEIANIRDATRANAPDPSPGVSEAVGRFEDTARDARPGTQASKSSDPAELGRAMEALSKLNEDTNKKLSAAVKGVRSERFLDISDMLATGDFAWQRATLANYETAVKAASEANVRLPEAARACLAKCDLHAEARDEVLNGVRRLAPCGDRLYQAHQRAAHSYAGLIDFFESHQSELIEVEGAGLQISEEHLPTYEKLQAERMEAERELGAARDSLRTVMAQI